MNEPAQTQEEIDFLYRLAATQHLCEQDHLFFMRYFSKLRWGIKFIVNWHHRLMADIVDDVISGRRRNVVINVSPGGTKTETFVVNFIARALALNPRCRFLHLSGSDALASMNSAAARDIVTSDEYQRLWPLKIAPDADAKKRWNVLVDGQQAGGVYATSIGGQVTGFRAGHMAEGFNGGILIDDPIKPEDAFSRTKTEAANRRLVTTVKSRKANPSTPIVLVMQRTAENDPTGFIEKGNLGDDFDFIRIPALVDEEYLKTLAPKYKALITPGDIIDNRFSYWPYKEPIRELLRLERGEGIDANGQRVSRHVYASQYDQRPKALGGNIIHGECFDKYLVLPKLKYRKIYVDTAQKTKERNDWSVFAEWGMGFDGKIYLVSLIRGRWEAPELVRRATAFWAAAKNRDIEKFGRLRKMIVEDKSSGTGLIQTIKLPPYSIPVEGLERNTDKFLRVNDALPYIEARQCAIPADAPYTLDFITEHESFTADDSHDFDDQVDTTVDAVFDMLQSGNPMKVWEELGKTSQPQTATTTH